MTTTSVSSNKDRAEDRDRELERIIRHALVLAAGKRAANRALRRARVHARRSEEHRLGRSAAQLAGYATLLGYIWYRERAHHRAAA
jgi:hypothetical protein